MNNDWRVLVYDEDENVTNTWVIHNRTKIDATYDVEQELGVGSDDWEIVAI